MASSLPPQRVGGGRVTDPPDSSGVRIPPFFEFTAVFLAGTMLELVLPSADLPAGLRSGVALAAGAGWLALDVGAIASFGVSGTTIWPNWKTNPTTSLVTSGPYRLSRNPQYLGIALLYVAVGFATGWIWPLALLPFMLIFLDRAVIPREERYLEGRFGDAYRDYRSRVRRWL